MADNLPVRALKRIGKAIIDVSLKALIVYIGVTMFGAASVIWIALRGNPHGPWFYAAAGALASSMAAILIMAILVIVQLSRKKDAVNIEEVSESEFAEMRFAYERAKEQSRQMYRVVHVTGLNIEPAGVLRKLNPYFDVVITFWNYSMFDVRLEDLTGWVSLNTWEFRESVHWIKPEPRILWANNSGMYIFRQNLAPEDVEYIRTHKAHLGLSNLDLVVKGDDGSASFVEPQELIHWGSRTPPTSEMLFTALGGKWDETA